MIVDFSIWDPYLEDKIQHLKSNYTGVSKIILNGAIEYQYDMIQGRTDTMKDLILFCKNNNIHIHIITGTHSNYKLINEPNVTVDHWPTFWLTMLFMRLTVTPNYPMNFSIGLDINEIETGKNLPIKYPYISMNKAAKIHRAIMMDMLAKVGILSKGVVIWRELSPNYPFEHWAQEILLRDQKDGFKIQETVPIEYAMSFARIVPESDEQIFTMSEKTGMALFFNKPFLVAGCKNFHKIMQELGFVLYDELFDYSFDQVDDTKLRYEMIANNILKYAYKNPRELRELYKLVFEKCVYNKKVALRLATNSSLVPNIWKELIENHRKNNINEYPETLNNFIVANEDAYRF